MKTWSRILDSDLGKKAQAAYDANPARRYHNWAHVQRIYWHAEQMGLPYDPDLDLAILAHDVIYDALPDKEERSAQWLSAHADIDATAANAHIRKTITHTPSADNRMVLLDLADFQHPECAAPNLDRIAAESMALYDVTMPQFLQANIAVMKTIGDRIKDGMGCAPATDKAAFKRICTGINSSISLAQDRLTNLT